MQPSSAEAKCEGELHACPSTRFPNGISGEGGVGTCGHLTGQTLDPRLIPLRSLARRAALLGGDTAVVTGEHCDAGRPLAVTSYELKLRYKRSVRLDLIKFVQSSMATDGTHGLPIWQLCTNAGSAAQLQDFLAAGGNPSHMLSPEDVNAWDLWASCGGVNQDFRFAYPITKWLDARFAHPITMVGRIRAPLVAIDGCSILQPLWCAGSAAGCGIGPDAVPSARADCAEGE